MKDIIDMTMGELRTEIDNGIMRAVQNVGINVSKEELIKALELNEKLVRCKDCVFGELDNKAEMYRCRSVSFPHWNKGEHFCSYGERKTDHE